MSPPRLLLLLLLPLCWGQNVGTQKQEQHPGLTVQQCTKSGGCVTEQMAVVIDANWRWTHAPEGDCYQGSHWDKTLCPDSATCTKNCAIEGAGPEYSNTYGVHASGSELTLDFVTNGQYSKNIGSRVYLLENEDTYKLFKLKNREFTFDADVSNLPCGLNGALYFVAMDADGGMSKFPANKAGAKYGTGYCDAQCPHDIKFISGEANCEGWVPSKTDGNSGAGKYGSCCTEFDVWEANSRATAFTAHACNVSEPTRCEGVACGDNAPLPGAGGHRFDGLCDKNGCDFQTHRLGNTSFWGTGPQFTIDTTKTMRSVTQFITHDGTDSGDLVEVRRFYRQGDTVIHTPSITVGNTSYNSLSQPYCQAELVEFNDQTNFLQKGGFKATGRALEQGMVLALSLWDDHYADMLWLDSTYPASSKGPGSSRGPCNTPSGDPIALESQHPNAFVKYMNIKYGEIGATDVGPIPAPSPPPAPGPEPHQCGSSCECAPGMNNNGHNMESAARRATDEGECCNQCTKTAGCVGWTYVPKSGNECWLKDKIDDLTIDGDVISGAVVSPGPSPPTPSSCPGGSLAACIKLCPSDPPTVFKTCVATCQNRCT